MVCIADDSIRPNSEVNVTGHRTCRNWDGLRGWARNHSACYIDTELGITEEDPTGKNCATQDGLVLDKL